MIVSPCIKVCKLDPNTLICLGCYRTLEEIQYWMYFSDSRKLEVLDEIILRRIEFAQRSNQ